jgi:hypothetical protein
MSEQNTESVNRTEYAWVIEGGWSDIDKPWYWAGSSQWSDDPSRALRFARRSCHSGTRRRSAAHGKSPRAMREVQLGEEAR